MSREIFTSESQPGSGMEELFGAAIYGIYWTMKKIRPPAAEIMLQTASDMLKKCGLTMTSSVATAVLIDEDGRVLEERGQYCVPVIVPSDVVDKNDDMPRVRPKNRDVLIERTPPIARFRLEG